MLTKTFYQFQKNFKLILEVFTRNVLNNLLVRVVNPNLGLKIKPVSLNKVKIYDENYLPLQKLCRVILKTSIIEKEHRTERSK